MHVSAMRRRLARAVAFAAVLVFGVPAAAAPESSDPIRFGVNDWTGQKLSTRIMGAVLERAGYRVAFVPTDYLGQLVDMRSGAVHVAMEVWATTGKEDLDRAVASGEVVNLGETGMVAREEWWFPRYVKDRCPGLPDWRALAACSKLFATAQTAPRGRYLGGPRGWGGHDEERVAALGLDFAVVHAETDIQLFDELQRAYDLREPIVLWIFAPHWVQAVFDGEWVAFPPYSEACYAARRYDCAKPSGPIWKAAWSGLEAKWPGAARAIGRFRVDNAEMARLIGRVELGGRPIEEVVDAWMATNETRWREWIR